ncbi:MAG: glycosyltransferase family 1 protein [Chlorobiales bacterium]|nr:glycosyltransferase family 1 protein [Chlorobiales bacterium]
MSQGSCLPIVMQALPRWDGKYASTSLNIARQLSKNHLVFYVDHPFTYKDNLLGKENSQIEKRKAIWGGKALRFYKPFDEFQNLIAVSPNPIPPINALPPGGVYEAMNRFACRIIWNAVNQAMDAFRVEEFVYINSFDPTFRHIYTNRKVVLTVYHCVDNISGEKYIARHGVNAENEFARDADLTVSTSSELVRKMAKINPASYYVPNAADYELFSKHVSELPDDLAKIPNPRILYMGNIGLRIDYEMLYEAAAKRQDWNFVFVGPKDPREFKGQKLEGLNNVHFLGPRPYSSLPSYLKGADVCLIPFIPDDLTRYIYPLKINEYLAAGKAVVSTRFADLTDFSSVIYLADTAEELIASVVQAMNETDEKRDALRKSVAAQNTWEKRLEQLEEIIEIGLQKKTSNAKEAYSEVV